MPLKLCGDRVVVFFSLKIIKRSCIEILAAEPSSVCAGGKRWEEQGLALVRGARGRGVRLRQMAVTDSLWCGTQG